MSAILWQLSALPAPPCWIDWQPLRLACRAIGVVAVLWGRVLHFSLPDICPCGLLSSVEGAAGMRAEEEAMGGGRGLCTPHMCSVVKV